uniref:Uncharacterized protein n=1 Tax=Neogobius melanostomus TaxID=47308 RepID=A0A8C6S5J2_9GOBI
MFPRTFLVIQSFVKTQLIYKSCRTLPQCTFLVPVDLLGKTRSFPLSSSVCSKDRLFSKKRPMPKKDKSVNKRGSVTIAVHAKPGSKLSAITGKY